MNSKQRVLAAMNHETPDRVPVMCQLALGHFFLNTEYKPSDIWFDSETLAKAFVELQQEYRFDGILTNLPGRPGNWKDRVKSYEEVGGKEHIYWKSGLETVIPGDDNPHTYRAGGGALERADYRTIDLDDLSAYRPGGWVWNTWHCPELWDMDADADLGDPAVYPEWFTNTVRSVQALAPDVSVHAEVFSPFTLLLELFGYEQACMALIDAPEKCHKILSEFAKQTIAQIDLYAACKPDAILVSSAFAGAGFISRDMYKEFVAPYEDRAYSAIKKHGIKSYIHTCGAIGDRLDLMAETCVDGVDTLDPPPLGTVEFDEAKAKYGDRFFFKGNLDAVNEMLNADDETFEKAVKGRLEIGKVGSGYILSSACSVSPYVSPERLKTMVDLAERYGKY